MEVRNNEYEMYIGTKEHTVEDAPVGLLLLENGTIICKSEYKTQRKDGQYTCDCIIVSSGENYCGGDDKKCVSLIIN